ncbi:hypothetical protein, partial [Cohnella faecalis]
PLNELSERLEEAGWTFCSYSVHQLNAFLKSQYEAGKLAREVVLTTEREDPITEMKYTVRYDIHLHRPFLASSPGVPALRR